MIWLIDFNVPTYNLLPASGALDWILVRYQLEGSSVQLAQLLNYQIREKEAIF